MKLTKLFRKRLRKSRFMINHNKLFINNYNYNYNSRKTSVFNDALYAVRGISRVLRIMMSEVFRFPFLRFVAMLISLKDPE